MKYDILTALLVTATRGDAVTARLALRLSLLITARFNWRTESFTVGQKEMAAMWGVTPRTAKRDLAAMRARNWLSVLRPAARGRVAQYRISLRDVLRETMPHWDAVGPDFAARMSGAPEQAGPAHTNVVPLRPAPASSLPQSDGSAWAKAAERLAAQDPATYSAWFAALVAAEEVDGVLHLMAPGRFQADYLRTHFMTRILAAVVQADPNLRDVRILAP